MKKKVVHLKNGERDEAKIEESTEKIYARIGCILSYKKKYMGVLWKVILPLFRTDVYEEKGLPGPCHPELTPILII